MSRKRNRSAAKPSNETQEVSPLNRMTRMLEILVRLNLQTMRGDATQRDMVLMLDSLGCGPSEIADLLGTTSNTVNVTLSNAKKKRRKR
jgi:DNA-directed RNA polymerase specialized sigma24 family protein